MAELSLLVKATVVLTAGLAAARVAQRSSASVRALILAATFGVLALLPAVPLIVPPRAVTIPVTPVPAAMFELTEVPDAAARLHSSPAPTATAAPTRPWSRSLSLTAALRVLWLAGTMALLVPLVSVHWRLRRLTAGATLWPAGLRLATDVANRMGVQRRIVVLVSDEIQAPMTYGVRRPRIVLPGDAPAWPDADLRHAVLHELEHVRRHDWLVHVVARAVSAIYWFHPLTWSAWGRFRLECERACDDAVLREAERTAYAEQLVMLARRLSNAHRVPLLSMADGSQLAQRVGAVLDGSRARGRAGAIATTAIAGLALAAAALIAPLHAVGAVQSIPPAPEVVSIPLDIAGQPFEAASVRPNAAADRQRVADWHLPGGRFTGRNQTLRWFITFAYAPQVPLWLEEEDLIGGPGWIDTERFSIEATAGRPVSTAEMQRLMRQLLVERFGLRVHIEARRRPAYRLVLSRPDRRLGPEVRVTEDSCGTQQTRGAFGELDSRSRFSCITMPRLAAELSERVGRPVIDRTGVADAFDATLTAARTPEELAVIYGLAPSALPPELLSGVSIFTALQEQFGVKLEPIEADLAVLVVDAAERPSPNDAPNALPQKPAAPPAAFEVASIKRNRSTDPARGRVEPGGRFTAINTPALQIVRQAYGVFPDQIVNAPDWLRSDGYDIVAKAPDGIDLVPQTLAASLRTLLATRFGFAAHQEPREVPIYELVLARADRRLGPRLQPSSVDCTVAMTGQAPRSPNGELPCALLGFNGRRYQVRGFPLERFAQSIAGAVGRPVVDKTGLTGTWNVEVEFTPEHEASNQPGDPPGIFTALEEQLGLKLEPSRGTVDVLVIDRVERPSED